MEEQGRDFLQRETSGELNRAICGDRDSAAPGERWPTSKATKSRGLSSLPCVAGGRKASDGGTDSEFGALQGKSR